MFWRNVLRFLLLRGFVIAGSIIAFLGLFLAWFNVSAPAGSSSWNAFDIAISVEGLFNLVCWLLAVAIVILFVTAFLPHDAPGTSVTIWQERLIGFCILGVVVGFLQGEFATTGPGVNSEGVSWSIGIGSIIVFLGLIVTRVGKLLANFVTSREPIMLWRNVQRFLFLRGFVIAGSIIAFLGLLLTWFNVPTSLGSIWSLNAFDIAISVGGPFSIILCWFLAVAIVILFMTAFLPHDAPGTSVIIWQGGLIGFCILGVVVEFVQGVVLLRSDGIIWSFGIGFIIVFLGLIVTPVGKLIAKFVISRES